MSAISAAGFPAIAPINASSNVQPIVQPKKDNDGDHDHSTAAAPSGPPPAPPPSGHALDIKA